VGLDVRGAAGEQEPIQPFQQLTEPQLLGERRDQERRSPSRFHHGPCVFLPDHVEWVRADHAAVGRNTN
jgi:hypothetical protein